MKTFKRICIKDWEISDKYGNKFCVKRGKEYLTSDQEQGDVTVFSDYWVNVPVSIFAGEIEYTK